MEIRESIKGRYRQLRDRAGNPLPKVRHMKQDRNMEVLLTLGVVAVFIFALSIDGRITLLFNETIPALIIEKNLGGPHFVEAAVDACTDCSSIFVDISGDTMTGNLTLPVLNSTKGILIGAGVAESGGAIKYASNVLQYYNGTDWVNIAGGSVVLIDTDTNASSICSTDQVLAGNTSCISLSNYLDDTDTSNTSAEMVAAANNTALNVTWLDGQLGPYYLDNVNTDTNASSICSTDQVLLGNTSCVSIANYIDGAASDTDTNASSICSGDEALLGNTSCVSIANYLDDTDTQLTEDQVEAYIFDADNTANLLMPVYNFSAFKMFSQDWTNISITESQVSDIAHTVDTDTNASSICSTDQVLLGNTSCVPLANYIDTTIPDTDTNASSICSTDQVLAGNTSCISLSNYLDNTDTQLTEDQVEAFIFDEDNTADFNITTYDITSSQGTIIEPNGTCTIIYGATSRLEVC